MSNRTLVPTFVLLWASGYVVGDLAIQAADPVPLLAVRFTLGALVAAPLALRHGRWRGAPLGRLAVIGLLLQVTQFGGAYTGFSLGVPAGVSALVMLGLSPLVTTALSIAGGHERGNRRVWTGLVIGLAGVFIGLIPTLADAKLGTGLLFTFAAMLGLAGGTVLHKRWATGVDARVAVAVQSTTSALIFLPPALILGGRFELGAKLVASSLWLGIGMSAGALIVFVTLVRRMDASRVAALLLLVPAVTAIASWPALGEPVYPLTLVGMAVAAVGVGTVLRRQPEATCDCAPTPTGVATGIAKICPGQPSTSNVPVGSNP